MYFRIKMKHSKFKHNHVILKILQKVFTPVNSIVSELFILSRQNNRVPRRSSGHQSHEVATRLHRQENCGPLCTFTLWIYSPTLFANTVVCHIPLSKRIWNHSNSAGWFIPIITYDIIVERIFVVNIICSVMHSWFQCFLSIIILIVGMLLLLLLRYYSCDRRTGL